MSMKVKDNVVFTKKVPSSPFYFNIQFLKNVMFYFISFNFCLEISGLRLLKGARRKLVYFVIATYNEKVYMLTAAPFILSVQVEEKNPFHLILSFQNVSLTTTEEKICLLSLSGKLISKFDVLTKSNSLEV